MLGAKSFIAAVLCATLSLQSSGCAWIQHQDPKTVIDNVSTYVSDAITVLNAIKTIVSVFFLASPNPTLEIKVQKAIGDCELALDAAVRATGGAKSLSQEEFDQAWVQFKIAEKELMEVLKDAGIATPEGKVKVGSRAGMTVPVPMVCR